MNNQGPEFGRINPSFTPGQQDPPQKPMGQPAPPAYPQGPGHTGVTVQPTVFMTSTPSIATKDYFPYSIFTMVCCCLPLGIAALIYSISTRSANLTGQQDLATRSSRKALILNNVAVGVGIALYIVLTILSLRWYRYF